jgi:hypothetical protein
MASFGIRSDSSLNAHRFFTLTVQTCDVTLCELNIASRDTKPIGASFVPFLSKLHKSILTTFQEKQKTE